MNAACRLLRVASSRQVAYNGAALGTDSSVHRHALDDDDPEAPPRRHAELDACPPDDPPARSVSADDSADTCNTPLADTGRGSATARPRRAKASDRTGGGFHAIDHPGP